MLARHTQTRKIDKNSNLIAQFFSGQATLVKEPTVQIQCLSGSMMIMIKNAPSSYDGHFSGMIYPKGLSKNSTCLSEYRFEFDFFFHLGRFAM